MDMCFRYLKKLTKKQKQANIAVDEVKLESLVNRKKIHATDFVGSLWMAVSSVSKYDFRNQADTKGLDQIPAVKNQNFKQEYLTTNMRNGGKIIKGSLSLQDGTIEKGTTTKKRTIETASAKPVNIGRGDSNTTNLETEFNVDQASLEQGSRTSPEHGSRTSPEQGSASELVPQGVQKLSRDEKHRVGVEVRVVEGGRSGIFVGPEEGARGCPTVVGMDPTQLKYEEASEFLRRKLPKRLENEPFVILGNTEKDIDWLLKQMSDEDRAKLTVYNPRSKPEVNSHERALEEFLRRERGGLVTLGSLFNGMESARVVFVYENPYASHFRANYMRASVELILIDRNNSGTEYWNSGIMNMATRVGL